MESDLQFFAYNSILSNDLQSTFEQHESTIGNAAFASACGIQGFLVHKKPPPRRTLQQDHAQAAIAVLGGGAFFYDGGTPVVGLSRRADSSLSRESEQEGACVCERG